MCLRTDAGVTVDVSCAQKTNICRAESIWENSEMAVVGLATAFSDVYVCRRALHFQNCLARERQLQKHVPHRVVFSFSCWFSFAAAKDDTLVFETLSLDFALLKSSCKRVRKNNLGKSRCTRRRLFSALPTEGQFFTLPCQVSCPFLSTVFSLSPSLHFLRWDRSETCSQWFPFCVCRRQYPTFWGYCKKEGIRGYCRKERINE